MFSLVISLIAAVSATGVLVFKWPGHPVWSVLAGVGAFIGIMTVINLMLKKKLEAAFKLVQQHLLDKQAVLMRKVKMMAGRATPKFQAEIEKEQAESIREAIELLKNVEPYEKWNVMVRRQADTIRAQFYFQLKEFEEADKFFKHALLMDPMIMAMQMTRFYKLGNKKELEKCFKKACRRFKDDKLVIIYALYSWILVEEGRIDDAIQILVQAKTRAENDVLKQNWNNLVNGQVKRFSNAALGDQWYSLYLESPKMQRVREQPGFGGFQFGGRRR